MLSGVTQDTVCPADGCGLSIWGSSREIPVRRCSQGRGVTRRGGTQWCSRAQRAELALVVEDAFQRCGIGRSLLRQLERLARKRGIRAFTGDMAYGNARMLALLRGTGRGFQTQLGYGSLRFQLPLDA